MALWLLLTPTPAQDCGTEDCDADGWTVEQGDCDDDNAAIHPGLAESCANELDDNCDRLFNEGCDRSAQQGQLWGGSSCRGADDGTGQLPLDALLLLPLVWGRRQRTPS